MIVDLLLVAAVAFGVITLAAIGFVPLLLPWPQRVRWTVAAQAMGDSASALAAFPMPALPMPAPRIFCHIGTSVSLVLEPLCVPPAWAMGNRRLSMPPRPCSGRPRRCASIASIWA